MMESEPLPREVSLVSGENVVMTLKRRYPSIIVSFLAFFLTYVILVPWSTINQITGLPDSTQMMPYYLFGIVFFAIVVLTIAFSVGYFYVRGHRYVFTNRRVILFRKFVTISIREVAYKEITDVMVNQGPIARVLNYGSVTPSSPGVRMGYTTPFPFARNPQALFRVSLRDVNQPHLVASQLYQLIRSASTH